MFSVKSQIVRVLGFAVHTVSAPLSTIPLWHAKADTDHMCMNGHGCVPVKLSSQNRRSTAIIC